MQTVFQQLRNGVLLSTCGNGFIPELLMHVTLTFFKCTFTNSALKNSAEFTILFWFLIFKAYNSPIVN